MSEQVEEKQVVESSKKFWGGVTNPNNHDQNNFRYLVHGFNPTSIAMMPIAVAQMQAEGVLRIDKSQGDQAVILFDQPERLAERVSLSMSLIDQGHLGTWGDGGIIVGAPEGNIIITSHNDAFSHNSSKELLKTDSLNTPLVSGDLLLRGTTDRLYNEVVALAKSDTGETLQLQGFFIKVTAGIPLNPAIAEKMRVHAKRLNLPLVEIGVESPYVRDMFKVDENGIWAHYKGNRYNLGSENSTLAFNAYDERVATFFPSPEEINEVVSYFLEKRDLTAEQAQQIKNRYEIEDKHRKSPKVEYDPKTQEISKVTIKDGYGKDAIEYWLMPSGYCWRVNMGEYRKELSRIQLNEGNNLYNGDHLRYQIPIPSSSVLSVLESRKGMMEPEEYEELL